MPTVHVIIKGRVQGVYFRASARDKALALGLTGWVRNTADGWVEAMASGTSDQLETFIGWCHEGPPLALVTGVVTNTVPDAHFESFQVLKGE